VSLHPTTTDAELDTILEGIRDVALHPEKWAARYEYSSHTNEFTPLGGAPGDTADVPGWFGPFDPDEAPRGARLFSA
jgi:hypothetical protein